jgi:hypothetical protein
VRWGIVGCMNCTRSESCLKSYVLDEVAEWVSARRDVVTDGAEHADGYRQALTDLESWLREFEANTGQSHSARLVAACGHTQLPPTDEEIRGCPEVIVRRCDCGAELYWSCGRWAAL